MSVVPAVVLLLERQRTGALLLSILRVLSFRVSSGKFTRSLMSGQPQLYSSPEPAVGQAPSDGTEHSKRTAPVWLQRLSLFVLVLFCVYLGVLVMVLPWWTRIWDRNEFILARPWLAALLHNGAVRGMISGLGLMDIWIGISEAVHYRDYRG
jgi:hypothetical protein